MERTWPNVLTYEAVLNQEYNKWQPPGVRGTPPGHNLDVAFVRMLAGPLDYHQGGMRSVLPEDYQPRDKAPPVQGTRGHQLAMYVVYQNHLPMMADYPAAYRGQPGLEFLVEVPTTWDETRVLHAEVGRCLVIARRSGDAWYLGGMTAGEGRELDPAARLPRRRPVRRRSYSSTTRPAARPPSHAARRRSRRPTRSGSPCPGPAASRPGSSGLSRDSSLALPAARSANRAGHDAAVGRPPAGKTRGAQGPGSSSGLVARRVSSRGFQPGPRTTRPGKAPVCSPRSSTCVPLTKTWTTPVAYWCGRS